MHCDKIIMYADDLKFLNSSNINDMINHKIKLEDMLSTIQIWYDQNSIKVNPAKTEMMVFVMPKREGLGGISVNFGGAQIRPVSKTKMMRQILMMKIKDEDVGGHAGSGVAVGESRFSDCAKIVRNFTRPGEVCK